VLAYAQENWGVWMDVNWKRDWRTASINNEDGDDVDRRAVIDAFWRAWEQRLNDLCKTVEACPGASELVEGLRALHLPMAIATSSRMDSVRKKKLR
jgi:beta-phosphoglucomutase-like phosphatase (HAD superfamily)